MVQPVCRKGAVEKVQGAGAVVGAAAGRIERLRSSVDEGRPIRRTSIRKNSSLSRGSRRQPKLEVADSSKLTTLDDTRTRTHTHTHTAATSTRVLEEVGWRLN